MIKEKKIQYDKFGYRIDNFDEFVSKKYYIKPDDEEKLDKTLQSIEDHMKTFKYYEDLPELDTTTTHIFGGTRRFENLPVFSIGFGYLAAKLIYSESKFISKSRFRKTWFNWTLGFGATMAIILFFKEEFQPQNWGIHEPRAFEQKIQRLIDLKYNLYKDVEEIKYNDKSISTKEFFALFAKRENDYMQERKKVWRELGL